MHSFLNKMVQLKQEEVARGMRVLPISLLARQVRQAGAERRSFYGALAAPGFKVIAEVKFASPSRGALDCRHSLEELLTAYADGGAAAVSVLTDKYYFQGSYSTLARAASLTELPLLQKDFVINPWQVYRGRAAGASAVLLIAALLEDGLLAELYAAAADLGMDCLVEVHSEQELERIEKISPRIIGVNNRDLTTLAVHMDTSAQLAASLPRQAVGIAESGIKGSEDAARVRALGYKGVLVGEALVSSRDPAAQVEAIISAAQAGGASG